MRNEKGFSGPAGADSPLAKSAAFVGAVLDAIYRPAVIVLLCALSKQLGNL